MFHVQTAKAALALALLAPALALGQEPARRRWR